jgi:hypothetical protein
MEDISTLLAALNVGSLNEWGSLRHLYSIAAGVGGFKGKYNAPKAFIVSALVDFYKTPGCFTQIWERLTEAERKVVSAYIWSKGRLPISHVTKIAKDYKLVEGKDTYYYYNNALDYFITRYSDNKTPLYLLFPPNSRYGAIFINDIVQAVGEMKREYSPVTGEYEFTSRENRGADFANIVRFANSGKLTVTQSGVVTKASAVKLMSFCGYEDYSDDVDVKPEDARFAHNLLVTYPLTVLCEGGGLLSAKDGKLVPSAKAASLLNLPKEKLAKTLFEAYLKNKDFREASIINGLKERRGHHAETARQNLTEEIRLCPAGEYLYTNDLEANLRLARPDFGRERFDHIVPTSGYYKSNQWADYERRLIRIFLSFAAALGLVDIGWDAVETIYTNEQTWIPAAFRINALGAYVLGLTDEYEAAKPVAEKTPGGFTVLPDYTIVIPESDDRIRHEIFFERFFTKVSATEQAAVYRLDFETAVRATNAGVTLDELREYLSASDKPLPENVSRALSDWAYQAGRIRIRQATILECDDAALLEEVIRYKGIGGWVKDRIPAAVAVDADAAPKIKKAIERNKRFCVNVI